MSKKKSKHALSTTQIIALGFLLTIIIGSILLTLPISSADGHATPYIDSLFTATTSVCVTGLVVVNTFEHWSTFGQFVILLLIQFGGLGIVTFTTMMMLVLRRKVTLKDRLLLQDAYNLNTLSGLVKFTQRVIKGALLIEGIGALLYCITFIPEFGFRKGLWVSVFNSISAFCNAGIDVIGPSSLAPYIHDPIVNITTMFLIVMGGIGFIVWFDFLRVGKMIKNKQAPKNAFFNRLNLHTKIVLTTTLALILTGAFLVFVFEYTNTATIGNLSFGDKVMASFFQSITTRTAGFFTFSQKHMRESTVLICIILMFIGGSPVGTAGGVKTSTFALVIISAMSAVRGSEYGTAFKRRLPNRTMRKALAVILISMSVVLTSVILLITYNGGSTMDILFETTSAVATVGLTRDFTGSLNQIGKIIIIICMYLGRIGPITLAIIFNFKQSKYGLATFPREDITVG